MNILFLGSHPTSRIISESNRRINSLYRSSESIIEGLRNQENVNVNVITSPDITSYPHEKWFIKGHYSEEDDTQLVSMINLPIIKHFWTAISMFLHSYKVIAKSPDITYVIIPYMVFRHVLALRLIARFCRNCKVGIIVPDIFFPSGLIGRYLNSWAERHAKKCDFFVLYTEAMADYLGVAEKAHLTIEGFKTVRTFIRKKHDRFVVMYSGTLDLKYGIQRLIDSMKHISERDIELHVYGSGNGDKIIIESSVKDPRIIFHGLVDKETAELALQSASVLVNPRNCNDGDFVKYSFPSKNIDYLASGRPAILCKLPGMPTEYYDYFIDANNGTPIDIANAIIRVYEMSQDERDHFADVAFDFISKRMEIKHQTTKICQLLSTI